MEVCGYKQAAADEAAIDVGLLVLTGPWPVLQCASSPQSVACHGQPAFLVSAYAQPQLQLTALSSLYSTVVFFGKIGKLYVKN